MFSFLSFCCTCPLRWLKQRNPQEKEITKIRNCEEAASLFSRFKLFFRVSFGKQAKIWYLVAQSTGGSWPLEVTDWVGWGQQVTRTIWGALQVAARAIMHS